MALCTPRMEISWKFPLHGTSCNMGDFCNFFCNAITAEIVATW